MIKVGVLGAGGYAGSTLIQILLNHPDAEISYLMSEDSQVGQAIAELYPHFQGACDLKVEKTGVKKADVVFLALPHGVSHTLVPEILKTGAKVIDLGDDYRFSDEAVYGLPEINRDKIKQARLIANPGCYPTSAILALAPLIKNNLIDSSGIIVDAKSGISGAGRGANLKTIYCERNEGLEAYAVTNHRHMGEIEYQITRVSENQNTKVTFVPHLTPMTRGILSTVYGKLRKRIENRELGMVYKKFYQGEPFVRIREERLPNTKFVAGTNFCDIAVQVNEGTGTVIVLSALDNLSKGAAGQAVQNMNIVFGFAETTGLKQLALYP